MNQALITVAMMAHKNLTRKFLKHYIKEAQTKANPKAYIREAYLYLHSANARVCEIPAIRALKIAILTDLVNLMPSTNEINETDYFVNMSSVSLKVKRMLMQNLDQYRYSKTA